MYSALLLPAARQDLAALDASVARRMGSRLNWLCEHFEQIKPEPLTGSLAGLFRFRVGDYRIVYEIVSAEKVLRAYRIRHRRDVYKVGK